MSDETVEFTTDDVVISSDGRVVINNLEFAKKIVSHVKKVNPDSVGFFDNCNCTKKATDLDKVNLSDVVNPIKIKFDLGTAGFFDNCSCKKLPSTQVQVEEINK